MSMASQLQRFLLTRSTSSSASKCPTTTTQLPTTIYKFKTKKISPCCSAMAINTAATSLAGIKWGSVKFQGRREEMEDDVVVRLDNLNGFSFAAVFDGHARFSSVKFLREELYNECYAALKDGLLLSSRDFSTVKAAMENAFQQADAKLLDW